MGRGPFGLLSSKLKRKVKHWKSERQARNCNSFHSLILMRGYTVSRGKQPETATAILFAPSRSQASEVTDFKTRQVYKEF